ncbi:MAG: hypothetical protein K6G22_13800 [Lachnospiraceae bacterium]|nr:hypothetical protein [Lachnospiraceae bacterium]
MITGRRVSDSFSVNEISKEVEEYLYRENIDEYFEALAERIKEAGIGMHIRVLN